MYRSIAITALALGLAGLAARSSAAGLESQRLLAHVPFAFEVGDTRLPPGDYLLSQGDEFDTSLLELQSRDARHAMFFFVSDAGTLRAAAREPELIFDRYGDRRFLRTVRLEDGARELVPASPEEVAVARATAGLPVERHARAVARRPGGGAGRRDGAAGGAPTVYTAGRSPGVPIDDALPPPARPGARLPAGHARLRTGRRRGRCRRARRSRRVRPPAARRAALARHRAVPGRPHEGRDRRAGTARALLHRRRERRRVEDHGLRPHLAADLRRPADRLDRRARGRAVEPRRHLRGQRRGHAAARPVDGGRDLQVHGRGPHVAPPRPARRAADRADRRRPARRAPAVRRGARPSLRAERRARHLPLERRRPVVREGALPGRRHGRRRRGARPEGPGHRVRRAVGVAPGPVGERRVSGTRQRAAQVPGRRAHLAASDEGPPGSGGRARPDRRHGRAERAAPPLRDRRGPRAGGALPLRRRGRELVARQRGPARGRAAGGRRGGARPPDEPGRRVRADDRHLEVDRRREDVQRLPRRPRRRRLPADLDRPRQPRT